MAENVSLQTRARHAADVAKWKMDQQKRIFDLNNQISNYQSRIREMKANLAETTITMYNAQELKGENLVSICDSIKQANEYIAQLETVKENAKNEKAPSIDAYEYTDKTVAAESSGLVCPIDGKPIKNRFCTEHGVEGIAPAVKNDASGDKGSSRNLICPECKKPLKGKYCPDHGKEGIAPIDISIEVEKTDMPTVMVCPQCGRVLKGKFCPEHGVEGVIKQD